MQRNPSNCPLPGDWLGGLMPKRKFKRPDGPGQLLNRPATRRSVGVWRQYPICQTESQHPPRGLYEPSDIQARRRPNRGNFLPFPESRAERHARPTLLERAHDAADYLLDGRLGSLAARVDAADGGRARVVERRAPTEAPRPVGPV